MCTHDSYKAGLFGEDCKAGLFRLRTYVRMILIRQDCLVNLDSYVHVYA